MRFVILAAVHIGAFGIELVAVTQTLSRPGEGMGGLIYLWYVLVVPWFAILLVLTRIGHAWPLMIGDTLYGLWALQGATRSDTFVPGIAGFTVAALFFIGATITWTVHRPARTI